MLFKIETNDRLVACNSSWNPKELDLERYIVNTADSETPFLSSRVFGEELLVVSNQVKTRTRKRADILAVDRNGNGVVVELKRDEGKLGVETQALQYLSDFSRYRGGQFVQQFGSRQSDLHGNIAGFLGSDVDIENLNRAMRVILLARGFDQSVYSVGEWLSSKGVSFKCISYQPVEVHNERFLSFSVAFDRSETNGLIGWQFFGLGILAIGGIVWGSRNKLVREVKFPIMLMVFLVMVAMTVLHAVLALFGGLKINLTLWSVIVFHVIMAAWYGYFLFASEKASASQAKPAA